MSLKTYISISGGLNNNRDNLISLICGFTLTDLQRWELKFVYFVFNLECGCGLRYAIDLIGFDWNEDLSRDKVNVVALYQINIKFCYSTLFKKYWAIIDLLWKKAEAASL